MHIFHKWTDWKEIERGAVFFRTKDRIIGEYIVQERQCTVCKKIEIERSKTTF